MIPYQTRLATIPKLSHTGTTIFTLMSALANEVQAINLGQGFPDFDCDPLLIDKVTSAMQAGHNQYPPMEGIPSLREAIANKVAALHGYRYDPDREITITAGATQALLTAILALVHHGDEVIVIEPAYDSYVPAIELAGGRPVFVQMIVPSDQGSRFAVPWERVRAAITQRTRVIIINTPHNPTAATLSAEDLLHLQAIVAETGVLVISDEVYEHMTYDDVTHESVARYPVLARHSIVVSSFGKTYHVTGWKIGYVCGPESLMRAFRRIHQFNVFSVNSPMQYGVAQYMSDARPYLQLPEFYQAKRDYFRAGLKKTRFEILPAQGTYFQLVRYARLDARKSMSEVDFCRWLTREIGVAAIPLAAFYHRPQDRQEAQLIRFCFAKKEQTLQRALERLQQV